VKTVDYPGPKARSILERMRAVEGAGPRTGAGDPLVVERATGATLVDPDGNTFVDLAGSFAAATIGHSHPDVVAAITDQVTRVAHVSSAAVSEQRVAFEEALLEIAPAGFDRVLLGISGADANDTALKLARSLTGRREVLAFHGGYFGRSGGVVGVDGRSSFRTNVARDAEAHFLPFPDSYRWPAGLGGPAAACDGALSLVRTALEDPASGVGPLAAIIVEPVQGSGGIVIPPDGFLQGLHTLCDAHEIPLIFDEIQSGFGRTGRMWAADHWGVVPDLMTVGKGIGGGLAVSAVLGNAASMAHWPPGTHSSTFLGNAVNLAAGRAGIAVLRRDRLPDRSARLGDALRARLSADHARAPPLGEVRGLGLFIGIELVEDRASRRPDPGRCEAIRREAFRHGVVVATAGRHENVVKLSPPLTIEEDLLDDAVAVVVEAIGANA
jgi:diaminobutyrate-2-oxoglutarate transaminase